MRRITTSRERLRGAVGLSAVLDAAFCAFEDMLAAIEGLADPGDGMFIPLVMAAASTADGRDAIGFAPSLPLRRLHPAAAPEVPDPAPEVPDPAETVGAVAGALAALSGLLADRLEEAGRCAPGRRDRAACLDAARWAREVHAFLAGGGP
jgi:hypothetical protein